MSDMTKTFSEQIRTWVVNDYFTPNIKAEVIFDTLLTGYIAEIVKKQRNIDAIFLTKEMSIPDGRPNNKGPKIDYVLADRTENRLYLVELKTTGSSVSDDQAKVYSRFCQGKTFGETLGQRLLSILISGKEAFHLDLGDPSSWTDETLKKAFDEIIRKKKYREHAIGATCAEQARNLIQAQGWTQKKKYRSRKYLYTLGQLADYLNQGETLWDRAMEALYLTPYGEAPEGFVGLSLEQFASDYADSRDSFARLLVDIIREIFPKTE